MNKMKIVGLFVLSLAPSLMMVAITVDEMRKIAAETGVSFGVVKSKFANMNYADAFKAALAEKAGGEPKKPVDPQPGPQGKVGADQLKAENDQLKRDKAQVEKDLAALKAAQVSSVAKDGAKLDNDDKVGAIQIYAQQAGVDLAVDKSSRLGAKNFVNSHPAGGAAQQSNTLGRLGNKTSKHRYA